MISKHFKKGDKIAIVSLSSGILGETFIKHELDLGCKRLREFGLEPVFMPNALKGMAFIKEHPEARALDLKEAFLDNSIKGILCAIGGDDTYRTIPYLLEDDEFKTAVQNHPKIFLGFSDTTVNHFMFYKLGMPTFYGQAFLPDLAELDKEMFPYTRQAFLNLFQTQFADITSSPVWYLEREDFSPAAVGTPRKQVKEVNGYEILQGTGSVEGILLGGCLDSIYDMLTGTRYSDEIDICQKYHIFPDAEEWKDKILLLETSEEQAEPKVYRQMLEELKKRGVFQAVKGIIHGKPMDEKYKEEYKAILVDVVDRPNLPILFNINIGHATPRCIFPLQQKIRLNLDERKIEIVEKVLA